MWTYLSVLYLFSFLKWEKNCMYGGVEFNWIEKLTERWQTSNWKSGDNQAYCVNNTHTVEHQNENISYLMRVKRCDKRFRQHRSAFAGATCHSVSMWYVSFATRTKCVCYAHFHHSIMLIQLQHMLSYKHICPPVYDRIVLWIITHNISYHIKSVVWKFNQFIEISWSMCKYVFHIHSTHAPILTQIFIEKSHWQLHKYPYASELNSLCFVWLATIFSFCLEQFFRPFSVYPKYSNH